ncbi:30S ribosomal protein S10 [Wolbachia endosymbiont of Ctenocephalides felis wCfeJ]|uniref:30S ribosomal protein S10 n=1 Tax=Wolbachia endosymbiont of Ctenocephalides felis wCfeJ TaxID=2732594 RepID=UPI00144725D1|nr:30S ribosomal protein S10 [Wolbachia endosymbiont of Ctenocephalides felis wCfeJ]
MNTDVKVYINIDAFDCSKLEEYIRKFVHKFDKMLENSVLKRFGLTLSGPVALPRNNLKFIVGRSPHVDKKSREQFERRVSKRLIVLRLRNLTPDIMRTFEDPSLLPDEAGIKTCVTVKKPKLREEK